MKLILAFLCTILLSSVGLAQGWKHYSTDTIPRATAISSKQFTIPMGSEGFYQTTVRIISTKPDTFQIAQLNTFGKLNDTTWTTTLVYNPYVSETPDSMVYVNRKTRFGNYYYAEVLLWTPFVGQWKLRSHSGGKEAKVTYIEAISRKGSGF